MNPEYSQYKVLCATQLINLWALLIGVLFCMLFLQDSQEET